MPELGEILIPACAGILVADLALIFYLIVELWDA